MAVRAVACVNDYLLSDGCRASEEGFTVEGLPHRLHSVRELYELLMAVKAGGDEKAIEAVLGTGSAGVAEACAGTLRQSLVTAAARCEPLYRRLKTLVESVRGLAEGGQVRLEVVDMRRAEEELWGCWMKLTQELEDRLFAAGEAADPEMHVFSPGRFVMEESGRAQNRFGKAYEGVMKMVQESKDHADFGRLAAGEAYSFCV